MNQQYPLTIYFDASCKLCNNEIQAVKQHDKESSLILIDCSATNFDDRPFQSQGITREAMMECLHVLDSQGAWFKGAASFELIYRTVGLNTIANFWGGKYTRPLAEVILAYSGALILVLVFGNSTRTEDWIEVLRITLILTLSGLFVTVMFVARNVWRIVAPKTGVQS